MTPIENLTIKANHIFFYYKDLGKAQRFYEETLGLERVLDYGFASIHRISATTYVGLVDEARGMHKPGEPKTVALSFVTEEIDEWYQYLVDHGVGMEHTLKNGTRHPTRGFVALDPEGYFLEFETFLEHEQNDELRERLSKIEAVYPADGAHRKRPSHLGVQGNVIWLYYRDLSAAQQFYETTLGFQLLTDQGFAKIYGSSQTGFIGLVDESQGLHRFSEQKAVTVSFFVDDLQGWYDHLRQKAVKFHTPSIKREIEGTEYFVVYDVAGYFLEFDHFLDHALH